MSRLTYLKGVIIIITIIMIIIIIITIIIIVIIIIMMIIIIRIGIAINFERCLASFQICLPNIYLIS